jgi:putative hemolysin
MWRGLKNKCANTKPEAAMDTNLVPPRSNLFALENAVANPLARTLAKVVAAPIRKIFALDRLAERYGAIPVGLRADEFVRRAMESFDFRVLMRSEERERIPKSGPLVVVANHPFGGLEGIVLADMLLSVRQDVRIMANSVLGRIPELRELFILVDPFGGRDALKRNIAPLRECLAWLKSGGCLGVFPAGEVAHFKVSEGRVAEPAWSSTISKLINAVNSSVTPVHFAGGNGRVFHLAGLVHPALRTALLPRELANKAGKDVRIRVGNTLRPGALGSMSDEEAAACLRLCTEALGQQDRPLRLGLSTGRPCSPVRRPLASASCPDAMASELAALAPERLLLSSGDFDVYEASALDIPSTLAEIGRLRELSFRLAGEGTGKSRDLDSFDAYYSHVFVWNRIRRELVGAYRFGRTDEIVKKLGPNGLYASTLFVLMPGFTSALGPALEMGRSFVRPEYQRSYNALLLLWKGIGRIVSREPRYRRLFGPVSISALYQEASRHLISGFFEARHGKNGLARMVKPRVPLKGGGWMRRAARHIGGGVDTLSELVSALEPDGKGIPVLMRQYLKLGGEILSFSVDHDFSGVLDGLVMVDLLHSPVTFLERYLGKQGHSAFKGYHGHGYLLSA